MKVIVDTCVWSAAFRRNAVTNDEIVNKLRQLIIDAQVRIMGPIRQELLSGIKVERQFRLLKEKLSAFPDLKIETLDYELAASFFNQCRSHGIQGSNTDFLICAVASRYNLPIFTVDRDFYLFTKVLPIQLLK